MPGVIDVGISGGGSPGYTAGLLIFGATILVLMPMFLTAFVPAAYVGVNEDELLDGYERFTGQKADTKVSVWPLTGIYTPFTGSFYDDDANQVITYGYTADNWLYGTEIKTYPPSQYQGTSEQYTVYKADDGVFRYYEDSRDYNADYGTGHKGHWGIATQADVDAGNAANVGDRFERDYPGDLYTEVSFDVEHTSDIFFVESSKQEDAAGHFKYDYTGYRMAFQPISGYNTVDQDGNVVPVVATTTSLSLIWYQVAGGYQSGVSGNLVLSGSSSGVAYLNASRILSAFNNNTSSASFDLVFNNVPMTVIIKIDPVMLSAGWDVKQCYDAGFWSIMVTSMSVDSSAYLGTDSSTNPMEILQTAWDILTFNLGDYNISPVMQAVCYFLFIVPLYVGLIALCLEYAYLWIAVGLLAAIQALGSWWPF